jgi:predicted PurR-regulated permease PerM
MISPPRSSLTHPGEQTETRQLRRIARLLAVILTAIVLAFCFFASSLCITLVVVALPAILVDPLVTRLESWRIPRSLAAAIVVTLAFGSLGLVAYLSYGKITSFVEMLPSYTGRIHELAKPVLEEIDRLEKSAGDLTRSVPAKRTPVVQINPEPSWPAYLVRGVGSMGGALVIGGVVPFLMFFILV